MSALGIVLGFLSLERRGFIERPEVERDYRARSFGLGSLFLVQAVALVAPRLQA